MAYIIILNHNCAFRLYLYYDKLFIRRNTFNSLRNIIFINMLVKMLNCYMIKKHIYLVEKYIIFKTIIYSISNHKIVQMVNN